jgi:hypothetical protein
VRARSTSSVPTERSQAGPPLILSLSKDERDRLARKLCALLIEAGIASGLNQGQIGKAVGRSQSFVSNYERGKGGSTRRI